MPKHVRMDGELDVSVPPRASYDLSHHIRRQRRFALTHEYIRSAGLFPLQSAEGPQFGPA